MRAKRTDASQQAIVDALRKAGCRVEIIGRPVDLAVTHVKWGGWGGPDRKLLIWRLLECKSPTKTGKRRKRKDQEAQDRFIAETGTPVVMTPQEALRALHLIEFELGT